MRGLPDAPVSTPVRWDEVDDMDPRDFTIFTVPARFAELGDLHQGIDDYAYPLDTLLEWAEHNDLTRTAHHRGSDRPDQRAGGPERMHDARSGSQLDGQRALPVCMPHSHPGVPSIAIGDPARPYRHAEMPVRDAVEAVMPAAG